MPTPTKTESHLLDLERQYWQALKDNDVAAALDLTDEPCIVTGAQGVRKVTHAEFRSMMEGEQSWKINDFRFKDTEVQMLGRNTALIAYTVHEDMIVEGKQLTVDAADSSTWVKREDGWKCAMHSEAILGDSFGRD